MKVKPIEDKSSTYIDSNVQNNDKDLKFKVWSCEILKYKDIFAKGYTPICSKDVFMTKQVKSTTYVINFNGEEIVGTFYEK